MTSTTTFSDGRRALFSARGDISVVPNGGGVVANVTASAALTRIIPSGPADGNTIAYTTDSSGGQQLAVRSAEGGPESLLDSLRFGLLIYTVWSPHGDQIAIHDGAHHSGLSQPVAETQDRGYNRDHYMHETDEHDATFSPDGRWLAYS